MANRKYPSDTRTHSGTRRLSDGSSSATSMSTTDGFMTPSTGSSTPGRQPWSAGSEYGSTTDGYHTGGEVMLATPSNTLPNLGRERLPAQTGVPLPGGASVPYPQQTFDSSQWGSGQSVDVRTDPGQARYATPGPGAVGHRSSSIGDDMASSMFVFPPSPPRPPGTRSSNAVGENKPKAKKKKETKSTTGTDKGSKKEKRGREDAKNESGPNRSFSSAGPSAPAGPYQPYRSSEFDLPTQPHHSAGFGVSTQSYHPTQSYDPVGPNTQGMSDTPDMPYAPGQARQLAMPHPPGWTNTTGMYDMPGALSAHGMFNTAAPWPSNSRSITLAAGAPWAGSQTHNDFNHFAFLNSSGPSAPSHYPNALADHDLADHDCHDYGASPSQDLGEEEEYDMMEDAKEAKNLEVANNGGRSNNRRWRK